MHSNSVCWIVSDSRDSQHGVGQVVIVVGLEDELQKFIHVPALIYAPRGHFDCGFLLWGCVGMCGNAMDTLPCRGGVFGCRVLKAT